MSNQSFDKNIIIAILAGGFAILVYDILQISFQFWFHIITLDEWNKQFFPKAFAGIAVMLFALFYALIAKLARIIQTNTSKDSTGDENEKLLPNDQSSESQKIYDDNKISQKIHIVAKILSTILIFISIIIIGILAFYAYNGQLNENHYYITPQKIPLNFTSCQMMNEEFLSFVLMNATSLSSQNPIDMIVKLVPYNIVPSDKLKCLPQEQAVIFDGASLYPRKLNSVGYPMPALIILEKSSDSQYYYNKTQIIYEYEGSHGYFYPTLEQEHGMINGTPIAPNSLQQKELKQNEIVVGSDSQTSTAKTNNYLIMLTWVLIGLGIIGLRKLVVAIIEWIIKRIISIFRFCITFKNYKKTNH